MAVTKSNLAYFRWEPNGAKIRRREDFSVIKILFFGRKTKEFTV